MSTALRVLIADDHAPTRAGVRSALERGGCEVCAEAANAEDAIAAALRERPDACLLDVQMPGKGIHAVGVITARLPDTAVVMLTVSANADDLFDALRAGATGYLLKDMDPVELPKVLGAAVQGEAWLPGVLTARLIQEFRHRSGREPLTLNDSRRVGLTPREWEVFELLDEGLSTAEIARRLFLSQVTVRRHVSTLLHKLGVSSRDEARLLMSRRGLSEPRSSD